MSNPSNAPCPKPFIRNVASLFERASSDLPILDIGCHDGRNALYLASRGLTVVGLDTDSEALAQAEIRAKDLGLDDTVTFVLGDILSEKLPQFGGVICTEVFQDIPRQNWFEVFNKMARISHPLGLHAVSGYVSGQLLGKDQSFFPGELLSFYRQAGWNVQRYTENALEFTEFGDKLAITSLAKIVAEKPWK